MKRKYLLLGIVTLLAAGGWWIGRAAWRAHRQLVSLDVRNVPLAEILRKIEWQTWRKIPAEKSVASMYVTLHVQDKPLTHVLDRLAEQVGARWSTLYAVYDSSRALKALDSALRGDGKIEPAGWTKLAPKLPDFDQLPKPPPPGANETGPRLEAGPDPDAPPPMVHFRPRNDSASTEGPIAEGPMSGRGGAVGAVMRGPNGPIFFHGRPGGQMEMWSLEELVLESMLRPRLGGDGAAQDPAATAAAAADTARKVHGKWTTYLAFRKSGMGVGFGMRTSARPGLMSQPMAIGPGRNSPEFSHAIGAAPDSNERFSRLTPGQRVQRERERLELNDK